MNTLCSAISLRGGRLLQAACTLGVLTVAPLLPVHAAVNPAMIPGDARWVIYADLNALRSSTPGKELVAMAEKAQFEKSPVGLDLQKVMATVGSVTAYGTNFSADPNAVDGTLVLQGTPDLRKIAESILLQATIASPESVTESKDLPFPSYTVKPKAKGNATPGAVIVAFPPEPIVLVSKSRPQVLKARDAFRGEVASVAKSSDAPLKTLLRGSTGAYLFAASIVPSDTQFPENQPQARILKMTNSGSLALGEQGPNTFAHIRLVATSDEMGDKLMKILQGMTAMMSLTETNDKQLAEFMNSAAVSRDDKVVTMNLSYSSDRLAQMIRGIDLGARRAARAEDAAAHATEMLGGDRLAEWKTEAAAAAPAGGPAAPLAWHTVENVTLKNGGTLLLARQSNGGKPGKFERIEVTPVNGGAALTFRRDMMRAGAHGVTMVAFPGSDGTYTIKVGYGPDPDGKASFALSVRQPKAPEAPAAPKAPKPDDKS